MAIPTLIVGLGGTGVLTVRALKRLYADVPPAEMAPTGFLAIDFDRSATQEASDGNFADLDDAEFLYLRPENIQEALANLDQGTDGEPAWKNVHHWFPDREKVQIPLSEVEANGAGQFRALGRLGLFVHAEQIENALRTGLDALPCETETMAYTRDRRIVIAASLAGGTGSGMLIDVAYLARRQASRPRVFAYLLLPEVFAEVDQGGRIYQNGYAALRELAHFKEQQVPFRAEHWTIPPIDVPVNGEEPFTRIYLFGRQHCSHGHPVVAACRKTANTILAQLNRTIQEKTLAIVANTASADISNERRRRRTHCFSTAGSHNMHLGGKEITQEVLLRQVLLMIGNDQSLGEVFESALNDVARSAGRALDPSGSNGNGNNDQKATDQDQAAEAERRARRLSKQFIRSITIIAEDGRDQVLTWLRSQLDQAHEEAAVDYAQTADRAWKAIEDLYEILLRSAEQEKRANSDVEQGIEPSAESRGGEPIDGGETTGTHPDSTVDSSENRVTPLQGESGPTGGKRDLKTTLDELRVAVPPFEGIERSIRRTITNLLQLTREVQDPRDQMLRYLFLAQLIRHFPFMVLFDADKTPRNALRKLWGNLEQQHDRIQNLPWWKKLLLQKQEQRLFSLGRAAVLRQAIKLPELADSLKSLFLARAAAELRGRLQREKQRLGKKLQSVREVWTLDLVNTEELPREELPELSSGLHHRLEEILQRKLSVLMREAREKLASKPGKERTKRILRQLLEEHVLRDEALRRARYVIQDDDGSVSDTKMSIISHHTAVRQGLFVRRTPNPQRKGFAIIMAPEGVVWPNGQGQFHRFLATSAEQTLECRAQTVSYRGELLWLYYEDLFNPPEHIRNLDDYYHSYKDQAHPELFHIDRRLLDDERFSQIYTGSHRLVVTCGNEGCNENLAYLDRAMRTCPGCEKWIRSRCGNETCTLDNLHHHEHKDAPSCPACEHFNHAAWWRCDNHDKEEVLVAVDKPRCPKCVARHHDDPVAFPEDEIGRRSDLVETVECPRCATRRRDDPRHKSFKIRSDLLPFYRHGVNGHDRDRFRAIARRHKLPEGYRCPRCRTPLIPFHHRELTTERYG